MKGLDAYITAIPADKVDMEKFTCECGCDQNVREQDLVQCDICLLYINEDCLKEHNQDKH